MNPGIWGKKLAEYLVAELRKRGIDSGEIVAEDWGWWVPILNQPARLALCCGHQDGDPDEFLCFTEPSSPIVKKWFRKVDITAELSRLTAAVEQILGSDPAIREIEWTEAG